MAVMATIRLVTDDLPDLTEAWNRAASALPDGWHLDSLRCASTGLEAAQRSDDWIAVAIGPAGEERSFRANDPVAALQGISETTRT